MPHIHAIVPLALLEALREADVLPDDGGIDAFGDEGGTVRFGQSATVAAQIKRYSGLAVRDGRVDVTELAALLRLVGRRSDAALVFGEAGRRAGRRAADRVSGTLRLAHRWSPGPIGNSVGRALVRRAAADVLGIIVDKSSVVEWPDPDGMAAQTADGSACELFGAATAELFRRFTTFDGALFHVTCRAKGDPVCRWSTSPAETTSTTPPADS